MKNKIKKRILQESSYFTGKYFVSPEIVSLVVTYKCNFRCEACSVWRMADYPQLSVLGWMGIADALRAKLSPETVIEISGGEPLLRKDLVCSLIGNLKPYFKKVGINTNGSLLDKNSLGLLKESGIDFVKVSLYSLEDDVHDFLRGFPGSAKNAKKTIDLLRENDIKTDIGILITSKNIQGIPEIIKHYNQDDYSNVSIVLQPLDEPIGLEPIIGPDKTKTVENLWPEEKKIKDLFSWLKKNDFKNVKNAAINLGAIGRYYLNKDSVLKRRCLAGQRGLVVYPDGSLSFCYSGKIIGNVAKKDLGQILISSTACNERMNIRRCDKYCRIIGCNFSKTVPEILGF